MRIRRRVDERRRILTFLYDPVTLYARRSGELYPETSRVLRLAGHFQTEREVYGTLYQKKAAEFNIRT